MSKVLPAARESVDRAERIVLSERDTARVLKLLEHPPKPTAALLAAAGWFERFGAVRLLDDPIN